jgi:hypothetical protein
MINKLMIAFFLSASTVNAQEVTPESDLQLFKVDEEPKPEAMKPEQVKPEESKVIQQEATKPEEAKQETDNTCIELLKKGAIKNDKEWAKCKEEKSTKEDNLNKECLGLLNDGHIESDKEWDDCITGKKPTINVEEKAKERAKKEEIATQLHLFNHQYTHMMPESYNLYSGDYSDIAVFGIFKKNKIGVNYSKLKSNSEYTTTETTITTADGKKTESKEIKSHSSSDKEDGSELNVLYNIKNYVTVMINKKKDSSVGNMEEKDRTYLGIAGNYKYFALGFSRYDSKIVRFNPSVTDINYQHDFSKIYSNEKSLITYYKNFYFAAAKEEVIWSGIQGDLNAQDLKTRYPDIDLRNENTKFVIGWLNRNNSVFVKKENLIILNSGSNEETQVKNHKFSYLTIGGSHRFESDVTLGFNWNGQKNEYDAVEYNSHFTETKTSRGDSNTIGVYLSYLFTDYLTLGLEYKAGDSKGSVSEDLVNKPTEWSPEPTIYQSIDSSKGSSEMFKLSIDYNF